MTKELLISSSPHETKIAVLEDDQAVEVCFQRDSESGLVGGIYKGRVNRVLPGMQSAFVDIGLERDAFLYVSDFFEESEEYDRVFSDAENRVARMGEGGAAVLGATAEIPLAARGGERAPAAGESLPAASDAAQSATAELTSDATAQQAVATPAETTPKAPESPAPAKEGFESRELQKRDFPGRRHRRRGRGFREGRFGFRRETGGRPFDLTAEGSSQSLELLPGESLAKYSRAADQSGAGESGARAAELEPVSEATTGGQNPIEPAHDSAADPASPDSTVSDVETGLAGSPPTPEDSEERETPRRQAVEARADAAESAATAVVRAQTLRHEVDSTSSFSESFVEEAENEPREEAGVPDQADEAFEEDDESVLAAEGLGGEEAELEAAASGAQDAGETGSQNAPQAEGDAGELPSYAAYTVREPQQRPSVAPRRGRKPGRGRFRGQHGRRSEAGPSRSGNHQPLPISELLKEGQEILVQIAKEPLGTKGARITSHIALPGRYLVYMPTITHIGVSRKIGSDEERLRLRNIILDNRGALTGGFIVRTAGAGRTEEELKADLAFLTNLWNEIRSRAERSKAPALLHRDLTLVERILRDLLSPDFKSVRVDNELEYEHVLDFVNRFQPALIGHVKLHTRETPLFEEYGVQAEIDKALKPKVWLKSGGYIVINQTEALVAIDVNTGKFVGKTNRLEDTIVKTNIDAVMEIVRQIRLRDLGGIIVIDFIDMDERRNRAKVVQALEEALRRDRAPAKILAFNEFGLVALTRKRAKQSLERTLCEPCPYCTGAGWVKSVATVTNEIAAEARKMGGEIDGRMMTLRVNPQVAAVLKSRGGALISEIEALSGKEIVIKSDAAIHQERFEIF